MGITLRPHSVAFAFLAVIGAAISSGIDVPLNLLLALLIGLVAMVGVPHGALDPFVARQRGIWQSRQGLLAFSILYLALAGLFWIAWLNAPGLALGLFLIVSVFHFSGDWTNELPRWARWSAGAGIVTLPAYFHYDMVGNYYVILAGDNGASIALIQNAVGAPVLVLLLLSTMIAIFQNISSALELAALILLSWLAHPLLFFVLYFCGLHSPRHLAGALSELGVRNWREGVGYLAPFTALTLVLALLILPLIPSDSYDEALIRLTFIGLAGLTVPHMLLMAASARRWEHSA